MPVVVETVTIVVTGGVSLIGRSKPQITVAVTENDTDFGFRYVVGKIGGVLKKKAVGIALPAEHTLSDDV